MLGYQRLDVYQCAVRLLAHCTRLSNDAPKGYASLADQLRRVSLSVPLNIAEGAGRPRATDAARFFGIAQRWNAERFSMPSRRSVAATRPSSTKLWGWSF